MKKIIITSLIAMLVMLSYAIPSMAKTHEIINKTYIVENQLEEKQRYTLYIGVEEAFNIDDDLSKLTPIEIKYSDEDYTGWVTSRLNIRKEPNLNSEILDILEFNETITYQIYNDEWAEIKYNDINAFVYKKYLSLDPNGYKEYPVPDNSGFKSYMPYDAITTKTSRQYELQKYYAYTGNYGIRMIHNRYCIALGTHFNTKIGTYVDLVLENGEVISCIVAEIKSDNHTDSNNIMTLHNGCVTEFLVDKKIMNKSAKRDGDISSCSSAWESPVTEVRVYNKGI